ncbi:prokineticin receptor 2-like [Ptychodera flava]|uniref:prokineticin receptor 2-like n=1 Tax=Ptychodera flava TaxID=63121 RepID=UPI00396A6520
MTLYSDYPAMKEFSLLDPSNISNQYNEVYFNYYYSSESALASNSSVPDIHPAAKVVLCLVYSLMIVVCGIGNVVLMYILLRYQKMRTVPNFLIANLAASDFLVAVLVAPLNLTFYLKQTWSFGKHLCVAAAYVKMMSLYVSTNSLLFIAIDRYVVIVSSKPWTPRTRVKTATIGAIVVWLISSLVVIPTALFTDLTPYGKDYKSFYCAENWPQRYINFLKAYEMFVVLFEFVVPLVIMAFCYLRIAMKLWRHRVPGSQNQRSSQRHGDSKRKTVTVLVVVVFLFALCWMPFHAFTIYRDFYIDIFNSFKHSINIFIIVEAVAMSNSMVNTIIYIVMNKNILRKLRGLASEFRSRNENSSKKNRRQSGKRDLISLREKNGVKNYSLKTCSTKFHCAGPGH